VTWQSTVVGVVGVVVLWTFLYFTLIKAVVLPRLATRIAAVALGVIVLGTMGATGVARTLGIPRFRIWLIFGTSGLVVLVYLCGLMVLVGFMNLVWWLIQRRPKTPGGARLMAVRAGAVLAIVGSLTISGYGFVEAQRPTVVAQSLAFGNLPAEFDGLTIALLTDIHLGATTRTSFLPMLIDEVNAAHPDLIVIAGDIVDGTVSALGPEVSQLSRLKAPYGVVVTTGNHEFVWGARSWLDFYSSIGLRVLDNDGIVLRRGSAGIQILGINDKRGTGNMAADLQLAYDRTNTSGADPGAFQILVAHQPLQVHTDNNLPGKLGIDLQLSGHTHGGQLWPFGYLAVLTQPMLSGTKVIGGVTVVTSPGAGTWGAPVRVGANPEIPLITLHRSG